MKLASSRYSSARIVLCSSCDQECTAHTKKAISFIER